MIQVVNPDTLTRLVPPRPSGPHTLTIFKSGRLRINSTLADEMNLTPEDTVTLIVMDKTYYIAKDNKGMGWSLSKGSAPSFYSIDLVRWAAVELDLPFPKLNSVWFPVAQAPQYINGFHAYKILVDESE